MRACETKAEAPLSLAWLYLWKRGRREAGGIELTANVSNPFFLARSSTSSICPIWCRSSNGKRKKRGRRQRSVRCHEGKKERGVMQQTHCYGGGIEEEGRAVKPATNLFLCPRILVPLLCLSLSLHLTVNGIDCSLFFPLRREHLPQ